MNGLKLNIKKDDDMKELKGAKILFIGPKYFGYEKDICKKLEELGAYVYFLPENMDYINPIYSAINKLPIKVSEKFFEKHFIKKIMKCNEKDFDFVFLIRGKLITQGVLEHLKRVYKNAKFIMYQWDSIENVKNAQNLFKYFDEISTFDMRDYEKYSKESGKWKFRPLFYVDDFCIDKRNRSEYDIDILFVGSYHSERNLFINGIKDFCKREGLKFFTYLYIPRFYFIKRKLTSKEFRTVNLNEVQFKALSRYELIELVKRSKLIIDYQAHSQSGLTMRTIESIGAKSKLITTNEHVKYYDFYNPINIMIVNKENIGAQIDVSFINNDYVEIDQNIYEKYSLRNWILDIFIN